MTKGVYQPTDVHIAPISFHILPSIQQISEQQFTTGESPIRLAIVRANHQVAVPSQSMDCLLVFGGKINEVLDDQGLPVEKETVIGIVDRELFNLINQTWKPLVRVDRGQKPFPIPMGMVDDVGSVSHPGYRASPLS